MHVVELSVFLKSVNTSDAMWSPSHLVRSFVLCPSVDRPGLSTTAWGRGMGHRDPLVPPRQEPQRVVL